MLCVSSQSLQRLDAPSTGSSALGTRSGRTNGYVLTIGGRDHVVCSSTHRLVKFCPKKQQGEVQQSVDYRQQKFVGAQATHDQGCPERMVLSRRQRLSTRPKRACVMQWLSAVCRLPATLAAVCLPVQRAPPFLTSAASKLALTAGLPVTTILDAANSDMILFCSFCSFSLSVLGAPWLRESAARAQLCKAA